MPIETASRKPASQRTDNLGSGNLAFRLHAQIDPLVERAIPGTLFGRLVIDRLHQAARMSDGTLSGMNTFNLHYSSFVDTQDAKQGATIGEWVYSEWTGKRVSKVLDSGETLTGTRLVVALGSIRKAGNGTEVAFQRLGVGMVQEFDTGKEGAERLQTVSFVGAVNISGRTTPVSHCDEEEFYSGISGWISNREGNLSHGQYPVPNAQKIGGR